tara:strand:- start:1528 stop:2382 length:855 start_codon:yes stop_codon:yes gene_type:complete
MRKICYIILFSLVTISCEDVISVDVPSESPRLVVDALIRINSNSPLVDVRIKASLSSSFFGTIEPAKLSQIGIQNRDKETNNAILLIESSIEPGIYEAKVNRDFFTNGRLVLGLIHNEETYISMTEFVPSPPIDSLSQGDSNLFNSDETEIIVAFTDLPGSDDFYLLDFDFNEYLVTEDLFYKGQQFSFSYFYDEKLTPNMKLDIGILGVDFGFYNYMNQIIAQSGETQGPFQTPAGTVRGNIINVTGIDFENIDGLEDIVPNENYPLGYFAVCETHEKSIIIE